MGHTEHPLGWPSVTQVNGVVRKPFLEKWRGKLGNAECDRIMTEASDFGSRVHDLIEQSLRALPGGILPVDDPQGRDVKLLNEFLAWQRSTDFRPVELERKVESKQLKYHGSFDAIGTINGEPEWLIFDWKTSSQIDPMYGCQLAAYAFAYEEETGRAITNGTIVRLEKKDKKPLIEVKKFENLPAYFEVFKACLNVWNFTNKKGAWAK